MLRFALVAMMSSGAAAETLPQSEAPNYCPSNLRPVCASDGNATQTFGNACLAAQAGYEVIAGRACGADPLPLVRRPASSGG